MILRNHCFRTLTAAIAVCFSGVFYLFSQTEPQLKINSEEASIRLNLNDTISSDWKIQWTQSLEGPVFWRDLVPFSESPVNESSDNNQSILISDRDISDYPKRFFRAVNTEDELADQLVVVEDPVGVKQEFKSLRDAFAASENGSKILIYTDLVVDASLVWGGSEEDSGGAQLRSKSDITITGVGLPTISSSAFGDFIYLKNCESITIENLIFNGSGTSSKEVDLPYAAQLNLGDQNNNIIIRNCKFLNFQAHGVGQLSGDKTSQNVIVQNCYFSGIGDHEHPTLNIDGAAISGVSKNWIVEKNMIVDCLRGIEIEGNQEIAQSNIRIRDNTILDIWNIGIMLFVSGGDSSKFQDIIVSGNKISGQDPLRYRMPIQLGIGFTGGKNIIISNNIIRNMPNAYIGISVTAEMGDISDVLIAGNIIENLPNGHGIQVFKKTHLCENVTIDSNIIKDVKGYGILLSGENLLTNGNRVRNSDQSGILLMNTSNCFISGNFLTDCDEYGVGFLGSNENKSFGNNFFTNNLLGEIQSDIE